MTTIAGTGHRPGRLGGYGEEIDKRLRDLARAYLSRTLPTTIISGMALGWDLSLAEAALELHIPVVAAVPFLGQEHKWSRREEDRYLHVLSLCRDVRIVSEGCYSPAKMHLRNE